MSNKTVFETLAAVDLSKFTKELQGATYVPWAVVMRETLKIYPNMQWGIIDDKDDLPYFTSAVGLFVKVWVEIEGIRKVATMPVLNQAHKSLKIDRYSYLVNEYKQGQRTGKMIEKWVEGAVSFDVNTSIMRTFVKCMSYHGMGIHVYLNEATPEPEYISSEQIQQITDLCKKHGFRIATIGQEFGNYPSIAKIPAARFEDFMDWATPKEGK